MGGYYTRTEQLWEPAYLALHRTGELARRAEEALRCLEACHLCPRDCGINRLEDKSGVCHTGRHAYVSSYFAHMGEEDCLRGRRGSGTIFFARCNLRCVFCQNADISQVKTGFTVTAEHLAVIMLHLQEEGCHNINLVTPEHVVPQFLEALPLAVEQGLHLPIVYNTSAYDSLHSLALLDGIVDIYMPDFKFWSPSLARRYLKAADYPETARAALREMQRQVGVLQLDEAGLARRGLLVRYLVMPGCVDDGITIMRFLTEEIATDTYVNVMGQYRPLHRVSEARYPEIGRPASAAEIEAVHTAAANLGLRLDRRQPWWWNR